MTHCEFVNKDICGNSAQVGSASVVLAVALICGCKDRWINSNAEASSGGVVCNCASVEVKSQGEETEAGRFVIKKTGCVRSFAIWWLFNAALTVQKPAAEKEKISNEGQHDTTDSPACQRNYLTYPYPHVGFCASIVMCMWCAYSE